MIIYPDNSVAVYYMSMHEYYYRSVTEQLPILPYQSRLFYHIFVNSIIYSLFVVVVVVNSCCCCLPSPQAYHRIDVGHQQFLCLSSDVGPC